MTIPRRALAASVFAAGVTLLSGCGSRGGDSAGYPETTAVQPLWFVQDYNCADADSLYFRVPVLRNALLAQHLREYDGGGDRGGRWTVDESVTLHYGGTEWSHFQAECDTTGGQVGGRLVIAVERE